MRKRVCAPVRAPLWLWLAPLLLLGACSTLEVKTDFDPAANFAAYRTFKIAGGTLAGDQGNSLVRDRINASLQQELASRGLVPTSSNPDLLVTYRAGTHREQELVAGPSGPPYSPYFWDQTWGSDLQVINYTEGTLIVDLIDARTRKLVWRAYTSEQVDTPVKPKQINRALHEAFNRFPPRPRG